MKQRKKIAAIRHAWARTHGEGGSVNTFPSLFQSERKTSVAKSRRERGKNEKKKLVVYHTKIHEFACARLTETATGAAPMKLPVKSDERHRKRKLTEQKGAKKERKYARALQGTLSLSGHPVIHSWHDLQRPPPRHATRLTLTTVSQADLK